VLVVGCGTSCLSEELQGRGYDVSSVDISEVAIEQMRRKRGDMDWQVADVSELPFNDDSFDAVIDKGTGDSLFFGSHASQRQSMCTTMWKEAVRVLNRQGTFICITSQLKLPWVEEEVFTPEDWSHYSDSCISDSEMLAAKAPAIVHTFCRH